MKYLYNKVNIKVGKEMAQTKAGVKKIKQQYGNDIYRVWGSKGGNPILLKQREFKNKKASVATAG